MLKVPHPYDIAIGYYSSLIPSKYLFTGSFDAPTGRSEDIHVTLKYGFVTADILDIERELFGCGPLTLSFGKVGVFHNSNKIVLKLSILCDDLLILNRRLSDKFFCSSPFSIYRPHCTIAYLLKDDKNPYYYRDWYDDFLFGESFVVDEAIYSGPDGRKGIISFGGLVTPST